MFHLILKIRVVSKVVNNLCMQILSDVIRMVELLGKLPNRGESGNCDAKSSLDFVG